MSQKTEGQAKQQELTGEQATYLIKHQERVINKLAERVADSDKKAISLEIKLEEIIQAYNQLKEENENMKESQTESEPAPESE